MLMSLQKPPESGNWSFRSAMSFVFSHLYPLVSLLSVYAYMPQIRLLLRAEGASQDMSMRSWLLWVIGASVTFGYAWSCGHDASFRFISFVSMILTLSIFSILAYNRLVRFRPESDDTPQTYP